MHQNFETKLSGAMVLKGLYALVCLLRHVNARLCQHVKDARRFTEAQKIEGHYTSISIAVCAYRHGLVAARINKLAIVSHANRKRKAKRRSSSTQGSSMMRSVNSG